MAILENLQSLRTGAPAVETVAYVDLRSGTVLGRSMALDLPQERFDALAAVASDLLGGAAGETDEAVLLRETEALVLCRSKSAPTEALCLSCAPDADLTGVLDAAHAALEEAA